MSGFEVRIPDLEFHLFYDPYRMGMAISIFRRYNDHRLVLTGEGWKEIAIGEEIPPTLMLEDYEQDKFLNQMVAKLDKHGYQKNGGDLKLLTNHLEDMRTIAFKQLKIDK
jgi:hypothetical protein